VESRVRGQIVLGSFDVAMQDFDQVFGGTGFARVDLNSFAENVKPDLAVDDFDWQTVDRKRVFVFRPENRFPPTLATFRP